jgi:hypothetical protein
MEQRDIKQAWKKARDHARKPTDDEIKQNLIKMVQKTKDLIAEGKQKTLDYIYDGNNRQTQKSNANSMVTEKQRKLCI